MEVVKVSASVRYSRALAQGQHKTVELSAEASIDVGEDWVLGQQGLYSMLAQQLRSLWGQQNGHNGHEKGVAGSWEELESYPPPIAEKPAPKAHWCPEHQTAFRKFERDGRFWYSHKNGDGWCKEQRAMKGVA